MDKRLTVLPTIAGVLLIVSAGLKLLGFLGLLGASLFMIVPGSFPNAGLMFPLLTLPLLAIIALALVGGIFSLQRRRWGLVLAGSIVSILPFSLLGIAAIVLVTISRDEFEGS